MICHSLILAMIFLEVSAFVPYCVLENQVTCGNVVELCGTIDGSLVEAISERLNRPCLDVVKSGADGSGGGTQVFVLQDNQGPTREKFFCKTAPLACRGGAMLRGERQALQVLFDAKEIKVPQPLAYGEGGNDNVAFLVMEHLDLKVSTCSSRSMYEMGRQLARLHQHTSSFQGNDSENAYGFMVNNTIGATPQINDWKYDWCEFWIHNRLNPMLRRVRNLGWNDDKIEELVETVRRILSKHSPRPSLLHGDLWGGNHGVLQQQGNDSTGIDAVPIPVIYDPATYYGDRETDIAMTRLFQPFDSGFYEGYNEVWPLEDGYKDRETIYNLYHILNHAVLFGGPYRSESKQMMKQILREG